MVVLMDGSQKNKTCFGFVCLVFLEKNFRNNNSKDNLRRFVLGLYCVFVHVKTDYPWIKGEEILLKE